MAHHPIGPPGQEAEPPQRERSWLRQRLRERTCAQMTGHCFHLPQDSLIDWFCCMCAGQAQGLPPQRCRLCLGRRAMCDAAGEVREWFDAGSGFRVVRLELKRVSRGWLVIAAYGPVSKCSFHWREESAGRAFAVAVALAQDFADGFSTPLVTGLS